ncbi:3-hydroxyacyl-CoA dehydrogenase family protein [Dactylosporangium sp. CA-092794]|uniref:3-hydroxyacyl-CoA dehydrogenase family protein n=1 Tax=Dactylosporangium sp. CA-092794 TaxID=3239929 RepID=UPI003D89FCEB
MSEPIAVVGGGRMGAGIAHVFAAAGHPVTVVEAGEAARQGARDRIASGLARAAERGALGGADADTVLSRVVVVGAASEIDPATVLVVEAVPEAVELKRSVIAAVEAAVGPDCVVASNTSSLSINGLAAAAAVPARIVGMHFFNPVPASSLVEVVTADATAPGVVRRVVGWVAELGKSEVVVRDSPGFATSRLGVLLGLEAIRMLEEGVADAASIDRAMELGYRHPMGPLRSTDLVGLDVRLAIAEHLRETLGERFTPPRLLRDKVARGELGRKSGRGFYDWS